MKRWLHFFSLLDFYCYLSFTTKPDEKYIEVEKKKNKIKYNQEDEKKILNVIVVWQKKNIKKK